MGRSTLICAVTAACAGRLREGAKYYVKRFRLLCGAVADHRYSPVRLMCSHPRGETWASNSGGGVDAGLFAGQDRLAQLQRIPVNDDGGEQVEAGDTVVLTFAGSVAQFAALVEVAGALQVLCSGQPGRAGAWRGR